MGVADFELGVAVLVGGLHPKLQWLGQLHQAVSEFLVGIDLAALVIHAEVLDVLAWLLVAVVITLAGTVLAKVGGQVDDLDVEVFQGELVGSSLTCRVGIEEDVEVDAEALQLANGVVAKGLGV